MANNDTGVQTGKVGTPFMIIGIMRHPLKDSAVGGLSNA